MANPFIEEIINAAHMRLLSPDWEAVENGYNVIETIEIRIQDTKLNNKIKTETEKVMKDYLVRRKEIDVISDKLKRGKERYMLEFDRLKYMIKFYDKLVKDNPSLI